MRTLEEGIVLLRRLEELRTGPGVSDYEQLVWEPVLGGGRAATTIHGTYFAKQRSEGPLGRAALLYQSGGAPIAEHLEECRTVRGAMRAAFNHHERLCRARDMGRAA